MPVRAGLPRFGDVIIDPQGNATIPFNEWCSWVDDRVMALAIGAGLREPLPQDVIVEGGRPVFAFSKWLGWVNRSAAGYGAPPKRPPLPPSNFAIVGVDQKPVIPFYIWLQYVDVLLA